jgi:hypothetical protein
MTTDAGLFSLNPGEVSRHALARIDLAKLKIASETHTNFIPHVLGPTQFRPGTQYIAGVPGDLEAWLGEFNYSETESALLVMTAGGNMFVLVNDVFIARPTVTATINNGGFDIDLAGWTDSDEVGAVSSWETGGYLGLTGTGTNFAQVDQQVVVANPGVEHGIRIIVARNDVNLQIGTALGDNTYLDVTLAPGNYSLAITPAGDFWVRLSNSKTIKAFVDTIVVEPAGLVTITVPYTTKAHFDAIRYDSSGDVIFVACEGFQQRRIERRSSDSRSWGIGLYQTEDGPFRLGNIGSTTLTASGTTGSVVITASRPVFRTGHVGALFRLTHSSQLKIATLAALNDATGEIRVTGLTRHDATSTAPGTATQRSFAIDIIADGSWSGTIELQRSLAEPGNWATVKTYTTSASESYDDGLDNQIIYYRLIATAYAAGSALTQLTYVGSAQNGVVRVTAVSSSTSIGADVLQQLGGTEATSDWAEGEWSDYRGWPTAVALHDGRLSWFPKLKSQLSASDAYASFDDTLEGDAGSINRTITTGNADVIRWAMSMQRLVAGTASQIISIRSNAFDEPLTPTAFTARMCSDDGAAKTVRAVRVQSACLYAGADNRLHKLTLTSGSIDYDSAPADRLKPEMYAAGIADMAVSRKPDNAHHWSVLTDGTAGLLTYSEKEELESLSLVTTDGAFERVATLARAAEDSVYFVVARIINGTTKRFIEKLAKLSEARGGAVSKTVDSHVAYSGVAATVMSLPHLANKQVAVWSNGEPISAVITLDGTGQGPLPAPTTSYVAGLPYVGRIKTTKLAYGEESGTALTRQKRVSRVGLVAADLTWRGLRIGRQFENLTGLPATYRGKALTTPQMLAAYDAVPGAFNGSWDSDARVCIEITSPYVATIMGLVLHMESNDPGQPPPRSQREE